MTAGVKGRWSQEGWWIEREGRKLDGVEGMGQEGKVGIKRGVLGGG